MVVIMLIGDALFSKSRQKVLTLLFGKPDQCFYTNEIVRWAKVGTGSVQRELERLVDAGLLLRTKTGNQNHYQANSTAPIFNELVAIVKKTFGISQPITEALQLLDARLTLVFIYGSVAKGSEIASSDIDIMLVGNDLEYGEVVACLEPVEEMLNRPINPTLYAPKDFNQRLAQGNHFLSRVMNQPRLMIKGVIGDIG